MLITIEEIHSYYTKSIKKGDFNVTFCQMKRKLMSISIMGVKLCNHLYANVRNVKTIF